MTQQYLVRHPNPELKSDHEGFSQSLDLTFEASVERIAIDGCFFTINWEKRILEVYTEHLGYHGFNMDSITSITIYDEGHTQINCPSGEILNDGGWVLAYCSQKWTDEGKISIHNEKLPWISGDDK